MDRILVNGTRISFCQMAMMMIMMTLSFLSQITMSQPGLDNGTAQNSWQSLHQSTQKAARKEKTLGNALDCPAFASSESSLERWVGLRRTGLTAAIRTTQKLTAGLCASKLKNVFYSVPPNCPTLQVIGTRRNLAQPGLVWRALFCLQAVIKESESVTHSVVSDSLRPHGL